MANIGGREILAPTPGATVTVTIDPTIPHSLAVWTAAQLSAINISGTPLDGHLLTMIITNDAVLGRVMTLGTGLLGNGIITGIISKKSVVHFIASGGTFVEISRTVGI